MLLTHHKVSDFIDREPLDTLFIDLVNYVARVEQAWTREKIILTAMSTRQCLTAMCGHDTA